jgi:hypothetical protein
MVKRAVVVGVNDYSVQGFGNLNGCVRDAQSMYHLLIDAFLFDPNQVWLYTDKTATSENIRRCISYILQIAEPGDVACLYYAGHGGLHPSGADTYYQTIIPYSGRFITDWDLFMAAEQLMQSVVNFTVILDSCHSGGMHEESESAGAVRGIRFATEMVQRIVQSMKNLMPFGVTAPAAQAYRGNVSNVRASGTGAGVLADEDQNQLFTKLAKSTLLAACRWDQTAGETSDHGFFTQSILDSVNASNFQVDHKTFHQKLLARTNELSGNKQTVQLRGQANRMEEDFLLGWRDCR